MSPRRKQLLLLFAAAVVSIGLGFVGGWQICHRLFDGQGRAVGLFVSIAAFGASAVLGYRGVRINGSRALAALAALLALSASVGANALGAISGGCDVHLPGTTSPKLGDPGEAV